jgi:hypothetical protein
MAKRTTTQGFPHRRYYYFFVANSIQCEEDDKDDVLVVHCHQFSFATVQLCGEEDDNARFLVSSFFFWLQCHLVLRGRQ